MQGELKRKGATIESQIIMRVLEFHCQTDNR